MKPISLTQIDTLIKPKQHFRDCYLVSSLSALARCENGRKFLQKNILTDGQNYCITFNNVKGRTEQYFVRQKECDELILTDKYLNLIPVSIPHNPIVKAFEVAMNKLLTLHPDKKPIPSRMIGSNELFEYNKPSNFMEMFTGIRPVVLNESSFKNTLKSKSEDAANLLDMISKDDNSAFIAGTGFKYLPIKFSSWHCYNIDSINRPCKSVLLCDNKEQRNIRVSFEDITDKFKFICGYFNESLR